VVNERRRKQGKEGEAGEKDLLDHILSADENSELTNQQVYFFPCGSLLSLALPPLLSFLFPHHPLPPDLTWIVVVTKHLLIFFGGTRDQVILSPLFSLFSGLFP
jgi:hypothetical protein